MDLYHTIEGAYGLRLALNKYSIPTAIFCGLGIFPLPSTKLNTVIGPPVKFPHIENPSEEDVQKYHALYMQALLKLYDENKAKFGQADSTLDVW